MVWSIFQNIGCVKVEKFKDISNYEILCYIQNL